MEATKTFGYPTEVIEAKFWERVEKTDGCWLWTGRLTHGYGSMQVKPRGPGRFKSMVAHRISYTLLVGPIPKEMSLDHTCHEKRCVRPDHLEPVSLSENGRRARDYQLATTGHPCCVPGCENLAFPWFPGCSLEHSTFVLPTLGLSR